MSFLEPFATNSLKTWKLAFLHLLGSIKSMCRPTHSARKLRESHKDRMENLFYLCSIDVAGKVHGSLKISIGVYCV